MIVRIVRYDHNQIDLQNDGCGCCCWSTPATRPNIMAAIEHHRKFIQELEELLREIENG